MALAFRLPDGRADSPGPALAEYESTTGYADEVSTALV
jgi:hypothetical protein